MTSDGAASPERSVADAPPTIGAVTAKYLDDRAAEAFKRQTDLEESIWRSLPLLTGGLIAAGAIVTGTARVLPPFAWRAYPLTAFATLGLAVVAFVVAYRWLTRSNRLRRHTIRSYVDLRRGRRRSA